jgi:hypothetical protein
VVNYRVKPAIGAVAIGTLTGIVFVRLVLGVARLAIDEIGMINAVNGVRAGPIIGCVTIRAFARIMIFIGRRMARLALDHI